MNNGGNIQSGNYDGQSGDQGTHMMEYFSPTKIPSESPLPLPEIPDLESASFSGEPFDTSGDAIVENGQIERPVTVGEMPNFPPSQVSQLSINGAERQRTSASNDSHQDDLRGRISSAENLVDSLRSGSSLGSFYAEIEHLRGKAA